MCTGGFRSRKVMLNALNSGGCDIIGIGRPLCGQPDIKELLNTNDINYSLPRYEQTLIVGKPWLYNNIINNVKLYKYIPFLATLNLIAKQYWYYVQIFEISINGKVDLNYGCLAALRRNFNHETEYASNLIGIKAVGNVYNKNGSVDNPPMIKKKKTKSSSLKKQILIAFIIFALWVLVYQFWKR